jgi:serine-type D-Ala-D-Ala carboxypeptidase/endopeptidase (penicillin-binding protein 4)
MLTRFSSHTPRATSVRSTSVSKFLSLAAIATMTVVCQLGQVNKAAADPNPAVAERLSQLRQANPRPRFSVPKFCPSQMQAAITSIVERSTFADAEWGITIEPVSEPGSLFQYNPDASLIPASNVKLLTTSAALRIIGDRTPDRLPAMEEWIDTINQYSDNDYADALLTRIGGQSAVKEALANLGVNPDDYQQIDGSGLSRSNRAKPSTFMTLLKGMLNQNERDMFYNSLAVGGVSGTLRNRFKNTIAQGRVHGKTGTLTGVRALSGYLENDDYGTIAFSIMVNQPDQSGDVLVQAIDQIVLQAARVSYCD